MVVVKKRLAHQLHKSCSKEGEGIKDVLNGVKQYAKKLHQRITAPNVKLGIKNLKDVALRAKKNEEQAFDSYGNVVTGKKTPKFTKFLKDRHNKNREKALSQFASYDSEKSNSHVPEAVFNLLKKNKIERFKEKDRPSAINNFKPQHPFVDHKRDALLNQNLAFKKEMIKDVAYSHNRSQTPGYYDRLEKQKRKNLEQYYNNKPNLLNN
jgi:hypothetical protein